MMFKKMLAATVAVCLATTPVIAADLGTAERGARSSGAVVGTYVSVPFGGKRSGKPQAGLRLQMAHNYRDAAARNVSVVRADALDLRFTGGRKAILYVANTPVTGKEARRYNLAGADTLVTIAVVGAAVVGGLWLLAALDKDDDKCAPLTSCL